uniref:Rab proteins geranylgeranyltransferase component A n=1 Tax=Syphacia muris TaxID=451379 RepID=A0A158R5F6_9BILA
LYLFIIAICFFKIFSFQFCKRVIAIFERRFYFIVGDSSSFTSNCKILNMDKLPDRFDVIVLGTGLPESIIASACARSGLSVLHLDRNDYYGGKYASFNFHGLNKWATNLQASKTSAPVLDQELLKEGEEVIALENSDGICDVSVNWHLRSDNNATTESVMDEEVKKNWRLFNADILPKVLLSRGEMVDVLCNSTVSRYCQFKNVDRFLCCTNTEEVIYKDVSPTFDLVPYTRTEIFTTTKLPPLEKRRVMQFFSLFKGTSGNLDDNPLFKEYADQPFELFLEKQGISGKLKAYIMDTIGILQADTTTKTGLNAVYRFLESLGRFGNSPFLWTMYGSGELPQCFCRLCAVFGGTYCLKRSVDGLVLNNGRLSVLQYHSIERVSAVITSGQRIDCDYVIADDCYLPQDYVKESEVEKVHRIAIITNRSLFHDSEADHISLLNLKRFDPEISPWLLEVGYEGCAAPKNLVLSHITAHGTKDTLKLIALAKKLYRSGTYENDLDGRPQILWSIAYSILSPDVYCTNLPSNLRVVPRATGSLDYSFVVQQARTIFEELWPDRDFLPPALKIDEELEEEMASDLTQELESSTEAPPVETVSRSLHFTYFKILSCSFLV